VLRSAWVFLVPFLRAAPALNTHWISRGRTLTTIAPLVLRRLSARLFSLFFFPFSFLPSLTSVSASPLIFDEKYSPSRTLTFSVNSRRYHPSPSGITSPSLFESMDLSPTELVSDFPLYPVLRILVSASSCPADPFPSFRSELLKDSGHVHRGTLFPPPFNPPVESQSRLPPHMFTLPCPA